MSELSNDAYERVEDARIVLETLGMDAERSNERSALVLLALLRLTPAESWAEAANPMLGTRAIMDFIRDEYGKGEKAHDYRVMRYRDVQDRDGKPSGVVVASSGFEQNESDGWKVLENDQMIVASNRTGEYHVRSI